jgi:predicted glycosyl hydrolase (DUF1957 family)
MKDYAKDRRNEHVKVVKALAKNVGASKKDTREAVKLAKDRYPKKK